ncbi:hypothetical protein L596_029325 [Steinernema carpocapsae]|uniref:Uncharacterized protein n=1 Tax=Steinernema carpocapsae TaxID=34508 RepID=A0A4U5LUA7_STECR|nr:hypothetical protein L596_029325 [Steinernema carpocapsae]
MAPQTVTVASALILAVLFQTITCAPDKTGPKHCLSAELLETPCRCCKMDCWYTLASSATHELGHVPGQEGEDEAMAIKTHPCLYD